MSTFRIRVYLLLTLVFTVIVIPFFGSRYPQPTWYHDFADQRTLLGIPHLCNVVSNLPLFLVGLYGLWVVAEAEDASFIESVEKWPYWIFMLFIALAGLGSAYYHSDPNNDRLLWDRLPMAVAFMALLAAIVAERIHLKTGLLLTIPLVLIGIASVVYWHWTEKIGRGDLRWYLTVQFGAMLILPLILVLFPARYTRTNDLWAALGFYALAKALELADRPIYLTSGVVSGHTLKHLTAGVAVWMIILRLRRRAPIVSEK